MKDILTNGKNNIYINGKIEESFKLLHGLKKYDLITINNDDLCDDINSCLQIVEMSLRLLNKNGILVLPIKEQDSDVIKYLIELSYNETLQLVHINSNGERYFLLTYNSEINSNLDELLDKDFINEIIARAVTILEVCGNKISSIAEKVQLLEIVEPNTKYITIISNDDNLMNDYISKYNYLKYNYICIK